MASSKDELKSGGRDDRLSGPKRVRHREEEHIRKAMLADARDACPEARAAYVECAKGRTITVAWYCKGLFREFNECLKLYTTDAEFERRKAEYDRLKQRAAQVMAADQQRQADGDAPR